MKINQKVKYYLSAVVALATLIVYLPALRNGFVYWDDNLYIFDNPSIRSLDTAFFRWAFFGFHVSNWHPLTWVSHALDYAIWGLNPVGHHLTNLIVHAMNTALVVLLAAKLLETARARTGQNAPASFLNDRAVLIAAGLTGLLFGIHPLHVESVAWVSERKDLLCALFYLLSIMAFVRYAGSREPADGGTAKAGFRAAFMNKHYLATLGFFILALMSKPMAVTLPAVLLILDWYPLGRIGSLKTAGKALVEKSPFIVMSAASSVLTILAQGSAGAIVSMEKITLLERTLIAAKTLMTYAGKMLLPINLIPLYPYPRSIHFFSPEYLVAICLTIGITAVCVMLATKQKVWLSVWGYYVVTLIPVLGVVQVGSQAMADRYTYLPSIGPFLLVASGGAWVWAKKRSLAVLIFSFAAAGAFFLAQSYITVKQEGIWKTSLVLWNYVIEKKPEAVLAYYNRGLFFYDKGRLDKAIEDYNRAIGLYPDYAEAYNNRGLALDRMGQSERAIADYSRAIALDSYDSRAYNNRGMAFVKTDQLDRAISDYDRAIMLSPSYAEAYYNRGMAFNRMNQLDKAIADYDRAITSNPYYDEAYNNRGATFFIKEQFDRAIEDYSKAIILNPANYAAYYNRGLVYNKLQQSDKADRDFREAAALRSKLPP